MNYVKMKYFLTGFVEEYGIVSWWNTSSEIPTHICPGPCITNVIATCRKKFSQWERSFLWKLRCHWLKFLRHVAKTLVIQGPGLSAIFNPLNLPQEAISWFHQAWFVFSKTIQSKYATFLKWFRLCGGSYKATFPPFRYFPCRTVLVSNVLLIRKGP